MVTWPCPVCGFHFAVEFPEELDFSGTTLEEALGWCLVWLMAPELGVGLFLA